ncbi:hypothetical protein [Rhodovulum sp. FJ3]|uniref:hypothetical protein n=1 Tax=Rhodovulum sp. FJ3 TaxID=3079053 RepID=UPI00293DA5B0|nr:hypothetical protein [Rhodovulum sp. FJ3]MDV4167830.1 hypothetical protein [Rhodovulum sp. FJ3]
MTRLWPALALVAAVVAAVGVGGRWMYRTGYGAAVADQAEARAAVQAKLDAAGRRAFQVAEQLAQDRAEHAVLIAELERQANEDFNDCRVPSAASVRRLNARWPDPDDAARSGD